MAEQDERGAISLVRQEGHKEGHREGHRSGLLEGKRDTLLRLLDRAGLPLSDEYHARIAACEDAATFDRWCGNVLDAKTMDDVLA